MPTLFEIIAAVESNGYIGAIRFEPAVYQRSLDSWDGDLDIVRNANNACSKSTARMVYSSSFGAIQVMGFNLYVGCGYRSPVAEFLKNIDDQQMVFAKFLTNHNMAHFTPEMLAGNRAAREVFAKKYNGSVDYVKPLIIALHNAGFRID